MASPQSADVVILGGGLSGLWLAHRLADEADVLILDPSYSGVRYGPAAPKLEVAAVGSVDNLAQLHAALGPTRADSLWGWSERALTALRSLHTELEVPQVRGRVLRIAGNEPEWQQLQLSAGLSRSRALDARSHDPGHVELYGTVELRGFGITGAFPGALELGSDFVADRTALLSGLRQRLKGRARLVPLRAHVDRSEVDGVRLRGDDGSEVRAEIVVIAGGAESASAHPWLEKVIVPVRLHDSAHLGKTDGRDMPIRGAVARHRFESWAWGDEGELHFSGCRWAEGPELGAGERKESQASVTVFAAQDAFCVNHLGASTSPSWSQRSPWIAAYTCDGLPLVGPIPGRPQVLCLTGWSGWGLSQIGAAVEDISAAVLGSTQPPAPQDLLRPGRLL